ncbi:hypothetical protein CEXT_229641 [Caerostris extrusa]|uniref:Uncharacterized protein n=1 Tax=Caerostris extrusa TaxID=172846 RepID=A0AAV4PIN4_CAEEX|nr:hypothetical protein CEXT_229641 [Caerostris extrusa]
MPRILIRGAAYLVPCNGIPASESYQKNFLSIAIQAILGCSGREEQIALRFFRHRSRQTSTRFQLIRGSFWKGTVTLSDFLFPAFGGHRLMPYFAF